MLERLATALALVAGLGCWVYAAAPGRAGPTSVTERLFWFAYGATLVGWAFLAARRANR